eukprot:3562345-Amphidinium_carterae.1
MVAMVPKLPVIRVCVQICYFEFTARTSGANRIGRRTAARTGAMATGLPKRRSQRTAVGR